jgi:hypothetical protein
MGWRLCDGESVSLLYDYPLALTLYSPRYWREHSELFWFLEFTWSLYFVESKGAKVDLGGGLLPMGLNLEEARRAAVAEAAKFLNELGAKLAAAAADEGGV